MEVKTLTVAANMDNLEPVLDMINPLLEETEASEQTRDQVLISAEEIFTNIASYAYDSEAVLEDALVRVSCSTKKEKDGVLFCIWFQDWGKAYNPLNSDEPDFDVPFDERRIGGLGIYMMKKFMDIVEYRYEDGSNIMMIGKKLSGGSK